MAGGDIQEGNFIRALLVVTYGNLHRITGIADINEIDAFDNPAVLHVQAGNNTLGQAHYQAAPSHNCWA